MLTRSQEKLYKANPNIPEELEIAFDTTPCAGYVNDPVYLEHVTGFKHLMPSDIYFQYAMHHDELQQLHAYISGSKEGAVSVSAIVDAMKSSQHHPKCSPYVKKLHARIAVNVRILLHISVKIGSLVAVESAIGSL